MQLAGNFSGTKQSQPPKHWWCKISFSSGETRIWIKLTSSQEPLMLHQQRTSLELVQRDVALSQTGKLFLHVKILKLEEILFSRVDGTFQKSHTVKLNATSEPSATSRCTELVALTLSEKFRCTELSAPSISATLLHQNCSTSFFDTFFMHCVHVWTFFL